MTQMLSDIQKKIRYCNDLQSIVRTMKALSASNIVQFEDAVLSLRDYLNNIDIGLRACIQTFRLQNFTPSNIGKPQSRKKLHIMFGSDQGLVGQFNDSVIALIDTSAQQNPPVIWVIGDHLKANVQSLNIPIHRTFPIPKAVEAIAPLVDDVLLAIDQDFGLPGVKQVCLIHNKPVGKSTFEAQLSAIFPYTPTEQEFNKPVNNPLQIINDNSKTYLALMKEYIFVSLFRACAESLASENASRLAAMLRAEKNIESTIENLTEAFHQSRQQQIDEELFDLISSFESLAEENQQ